MKRIVVILVYVLLQKVADSGSDEFHSLDPKHDKTKLQMNMIVEIFQTFDGQRIINLMREWISQNQKIEQTFVNTSSKIVHFTKFNSVKDSRYHSVVCVFGRTLEISSETLQNPFEGYVQFTKSGNFSRCQVSFIFEINSWSITFTVNTSNKFSFKYPQFPTARSYLNVKFDEELCKDINEIQRQLLYTDVQRAIEEILRSQFEAVVKPIIQSILNDCLFPKLSKNDISDGKGNYQYVRLMQECNSVAFPWLTDCNELIVTGLYGSRYLTFKDFLTNDGSNHLLFDSVKIRWNVISMIPKERNYEVYGLRISHRFGDGHPTVYSEVVAETPIGHYSRIVDAESEQKLRKLLENWIEEAIARTSLLTQNFTNTMKEILHPFDKQTFKISFVDLEIQPQEHLFKDTIYSLQIKTEGFRLENTTCVLGNMNISTLSYKNIKGQFTYFHSVEKGNIQTFQVFVDVCIKETRIYISLNRYSNHTNEAGIHIDDNFNDADTTIMITSPENRLNQAVRRSIGKSVVEKFIYIIRNKIQKTANPTFRPIVDVCKHSWRKSIDPHSNHLNDQYPYFTKILDYWISNVDPFFTQRINLAINGSWNFNFINIRNVEESIIVGGLRLENIVGTINIEQQDDSNKTLSLNYNMSHLSLSINHTDKYITVQLPPPSEYWIGSSNFSLPPENATYVMKNFQYTLASYIEQSIYDDSDYRVNFRTTAENIITVESEDTQSNYDKSFIIIKWIVRTLLWEFEERYKYYEYNYLSKPLIVEEICDCGNHSKSETAFFTSCLSVANGTKNSSENISKVSYKILKYCANENLEPFNISNYHSPNDYTHAYFCESYFKTLRFSEHNFYLINGTSTYPSDYFSIYQIRIYNLHNLKSIRFKFYPQTIYRQFEIIMVNLTIHIKWIQNIGNLHSRIPREMKLKIDKLILAGKMSIFKLTFGNCSQVLLSHQENSRIVEKLNGTLVPIILNAIELSILKEFYRIRLEL